MTAWRGPLTRRHRVEARLVLVVAVMAAAALGMVVGGAPAGARLGKRSPPTTTTTTTAPPNTTTVPVSSRPTGKLVPPTGALLGGFMSPAGTVWSQSAVTAREALLGRKLDVDHRYYGWTTVFPTPNDAWDVQNGRIPMITWQPFGTTLDAINAGSSDDMIRSRARGVASFGKPIFLRWAHEMNGNWYPWDGYHNNTPGLTDGPAKYVAAWRHIHDLFVAAGATNAVWLWCPNRASFPTAAWNAYQNYYPGNGYVDWVCIDGYNRFQTDWRSFSTLFTPIYTTYATTKPVMVGETSSVEGLTAGQKAAWIADAQAAVKQSFPAIAAFLWFDSQSSGHDWRIDSSATSLSAFKTLALDPYFRTRL
ncbi:MAG TPA: glycosyl hydrolase [Acidimicrobiia bacterium]